MGSFLAMLRKRLASHAVGGGADSTQVDWQRIDGYSQLYALIPRTHFANQQAFVAGPLERYLQLVEASPGRAGARIMEHVCASLRWFREAEAARGRSTAWLDAAADALVRARFSSGSADHLYMIEVFEGRGTHNYRASDEEEG